MSDFMSEGLTHYIKGKGKEILIPLLYHAGYYDLLLNRLKDQAVVLMYHRVSSLPDDGCHTSFEIGVEKEYFEMQMGYIKEKMYPISLTDLVRCIIAGKTVPERAVAVTFDDGYEDNYTHAYPVLKRYGIPATIFVSSGFTDSTQIYWWDRIGEIVKNTPSPLLDMTILSRFSKEAAEHQKGIPLSGIDDKKKALLLLIDLLRELGNTELTDAIGLLQTQLSVRHEDIDTTRHRILTWCQIKEMSENGIDFGAHTVSHPNLAKIRDAAEAKKEIEDSKRHLEEKINKPVHGFAYPYGFSKHYNEAIKKMVADAGFLYACTAETGIIRAKNDAYKLDRVSMPNTPLPLSLRMISKCIQ